MTEFDDVGAADPLPPERGHSSLSQHSNARSVSSMDGESRPKKLFTLSDNENLRVVVSCLYHMVESLRRQDVLLKCAQLSGHSVSKLETLQKQFLQELGELLFSFFGFSCFSRALGGHRQTSVHLPAGRDPSVRAGRLRPLPHQEGGPAGLEGHAGHTGRFGVPPTGEEPTAAGPEPEYRRGHCRSESSFVFIIFPAKVASKLKATNFTNDEVLGLDVRRLGPGVVTKRARPAGSRAFRRQEGITSASALNTDEISEDAAREEGSPPAALPAPEPDPGEESVRKNEYFSKPMQVVMLQKNAEGQVEQTRKFRSTFVNAFMLCSFDVGFGHRLRGGGFAAERRNDAHRVQSGALRAALVHQSEAQRRGVVHPDSPHEVLWLQVARRRLQPVRPAGAGAAERGRLPTPPLRVAVRAAGEIPRLCGVHHWFRWRRTGN